jgi:hypothetical protein
MCRLGLACAAVLAIWLGCVASANAQTATDERPKRVIGATAKITEISTGLKFSARVDTGAETCSLHVDEIEIKNEAPIPTRNIGKAIRFLVKNEKGKSQWIETTVSDVVQVKSSAQKDGEIDRRYKVWLSLKWHGYRKQVLVTLNDRTEMAYPLLLGRNYLRGDFVVDVDVDNPE